MSIQTTTQHNPVAASLHVNLTRVVRILMALADMDQQQLAKAMGYDKSVITRSFNNQRPWKLDDLEKLAEVFDRPISYFFEPADTLIRNRCFREADLLISAA